MAASHSQEPRRRARRRALQALYQWRLNPRPAAEILAQFHAVQDFTGVDVQWFESLVRGAIESAEMLDERLGEFLDRQARHLDVIEHVILHLGAWELLNHPELPAPVILDEAVDLARRFGAEQGHGFVNAVLDKAARAWREADPAPGRPEGNE
jgi:N utilization substance protein B